MIDTTLKDLKKELTEKLGLEPDSFELESIPNLSANQNNSKPSQDEDESEFIFEPIEFDDKSLEQIGTSSDFEKGVSQAAELAGFYSTLLNFGVSLSVAEKLLLMKYDSDEASKINNLLVSFQKESAKESAELQKILAVKKQIAAESQEL